jgi:hypothetical protein
MSYLNESSAAPATIAARLPPRDLLRQVLAEYVAETPAGFALIRAAWNLPSVWPAQVERVYRFGPPAELKAASGWPFFWIYAAEAAFTAVWEAQFCMHPVTHPGRFMLSPGAENGLIATLSFDDSVSWFDLSGDAASKLGIYDPLRSPDYAWCQWLGVELDQLMVERGGGVHGFIYPSRRHPGQRAYAISSRSRDSLAVMLRQRVVRFVNSAEYAELMADPCRIDIGAL